MNELSSKKVLDKCLPGCRFIFGSCCLCGWASDSEIDAVPQLFHGLLTWFEPLQIHLCVSASSEYFNSRSGVLKRRAFLKATVP